MRVTRGVATPTQTVLERANAPVNAVWKPHAGPQTFVLGRYEEEILYGGARSGGKTDAGLAWFTRWTHIPELRCLVLRRNADDLYDWIDRAQRMYAPLGAIVVGKPAEVRFPSGARIRCGHLKDEDAFEKYQGHEYHKMLIEELTQIDSLESYLKLLGSNRSTVPGLRAQIFCTTNPGGVGANWVKQRWGISGAPREPIFRVDEKTKHRLVFIPARVEDNPTILNENPEYITFLEGLPTDLRKAWREGNWDIFSGQFFTGWNQEKHVVEPFEIPPSWARFRGIDPSGRHGHTACCWYAVDHDGTVWVYREYYATGLDIDQHAKNIAELSDGEEYRWTVMDSAAWFKVGMPETTAEIFEREGVNGLVQASKKRVQGWDTVQRYLRYDELVPPKLRIFKTCPNLIRTLPMMIMSDKNPQDIASPGQEDDLPDQIRYLLQTFRDQSVTRPMTHTEKYLTRLKESSTINMDRFKYKR